MAYAAYAKGNDTLKPPGYVELGQMKETWTIEIMKFQPKYIGRQGLT
jgi:hypothetical protein